MRKICIITGTRAEYGLLYWLIKDIQEDADLELNSERIPRCLRRG